MNQRFERFSLAISAIDRYWHKIALEVMSEYGLKGSCAVYLVTIYNCPEGITAGQLCEQCGRNKSDVSRVILALEQKGFVQRTNQENRSYRARFTLTEQGKAVAEHVNERARVAADLGSQGMTEAEREAFYAGLELIADNLKALSIRGISNYKH